MIAVPASDCYDILRMNPGKRSGIYWIKLWKSRKSLEVFCDLETDKGGWTVFIYLSTHIYSFMNLFIYHRNFRFVSRVMKYQSKIQSLHFIVIIQILDFVRLACETMNGQCNERGQTNCTVCLSVRLSVFHLL